VLNKSQDFIYCVQFTVHFHFPHKRYKKKSMAVNRPLCRGEDKSSNKLISQEANMEKFKSEIFSTL